MPLSWMQGQKYARFGGVLYLDSAASLWHFGPFKEKTPCSASPLVRPLIICTGRCSDRTTCAEGNSTTEPLLVTYNILNAHAAAVARFRDLVPDGRISSNFVTEWYEPLTDSVEDQVCHPCALSDHTFRRFFRIPWTILITGLNRDQM